MTGQWDRTAAASFLRDAIAGVIIALLLVLLLNNSIRAAVTARLTKPSKMICSISFPVIDK